MTGRFGGIPRGRPLPGARAIAGYVWQDEKLHRSAYGLPRDEFGLQDLNGRLTGFTNWIDHALSERVGKRRARHRQQEVAE